jgi:undecaprenyl-diphosphatase
LVTHRQQHLASPAQAETAPLRPARPLLPPGARRPAAIIAVACVAVVAVLAIIFAGHASGSAADRAADSWVLGLGVPRASMSRVSLIGGLTGSAALTAALALCCLAARRLRAAVLAVAGVALASALTEYVLKPLIHRTIDGYLSYPSGHTTVLFALATALAVVLLRPDGRRPRPALRLAAVIAAVLVASVVGLAMVGLHYHYVTDAIGGAAAGIATVLGMAFLLDWVLARRGGAGLRQRAQRGG